MDRTGVTRTAFVTGATGFLGLNLVEELLRRGWRVTAFSLPGVETHGLQDRGVTLAFGNITDLDSVLAAMPEEVDAIFHVAANTSSWSWNDAQQYGDNVDGTRNMVDAALARRARRFIYTSTITAYGYHPGRRIDEGTESNAITSDINYGVTKFLAEQIVKEAVKKGLPAVILNPVNILGPHDTNNWTRQLIRPVYEGRMRAIPPGRAMWAHVKDVVDAHISAVDRGAVGQNYLLGGVEADFKEVANEIESLIGKPPSTRVTPRFILWIALLAATAKSRIDGREPFLTPERYKRAVAHISCNFGKAVRDLGYRTTPLRTTLRDTLDWLRSEKLLGVDHVDVSQEPHHVELLENDQVRVYMATIEPGMKTLYHRHHEDTIYVVVEGGVYRSEVPEGRKQKQGRVGFPRSFGLGTKLSWGLRRLITGWLDLPSASFFVQHHRRFPLVHRVCGSSDNAKSLKLMGIEIRERHLDRGAATSRLPSPFQCEYEENDFEIDRLTVEAGGSTGPHHIGHPGLLVVTRGGGRVTVDGIHPPVEEIMAPGNLRWLDRDAELEATVAGPGGLEALLIALK